MKNHYLDFTSSVEAHHLRLRSREVAPVVCRPHKRAPRRDHYQSRHERVHRRRDEHVLRFHDN